MIKRIRRRFIAISMLAVSLVLSGILTVIIVGNLMDVRKTVETRMGLLLSLEENGELYREERQLMDGEQPPEGEVLPEGEQPPEECPVCHAAADKFKKVEEE